MPRGAAGRPVSEVRCWALAVFRHETLLFVLESNWTAYPVVCRASPQLCGEDCCRREANKKHNSRRGGTISGGEEEGGATVRHNGRSEEHGGVDAEREGGA